MKVYFTLGIIISTLAIAPAVRMLIYYLFFFLFEFHIFYCGVHRFLKIALKELLGLANPGWHIGKEPTCQCRRCRRRRFYPWVRKVPWRRAWQPARVFSPRESHGQRSLVGCSPWGHTESDTTERLSSSHCLIDCGQNSLQRCACVLSHFSHVTRWTAAPQAPLPMGFSRQEYWSGLQVPSPGDLLDPGIEPGFPTL